MLKNGLIAAVVAVVLILAAGQTQAVPITFGFSGTITGVGDPNGLLDGSIVVDDPFWGTYTFESTMTDDLPNDLHRGLYTKPAPATSIMTATLGNYTFVGPSSKLLVENSDKDMFYLASYNFQSEGFDFEGMVVNLFDENGASLASDALPLAPPPMQYFVHRAFMLAGTEDSFGFSGRVEELFLVPEPRSSLMIVFGLFLACNRRRG